MVIHIFINRIKEVVPRQRFVTPLKHNTHSTMHMFHKFAYCVHSVLPDRFAISKNSQSNDKY